MEQARMSGDVVWGLDDEAATLQCGPLTARVHLNELSAGLSDLAWRGRSCTAFEVLRPRVAPDTQLVESYVRGADLVANFTQSVTCAVAPHYYWRARNIASFEAAGIEMVVSVQTDLLESQPGSVVRSLAQGVRLFHAARLEPRAFAEHGANQPLSSESATNLVVFRHDQLGISYAELVHPSDLESFQLAFRQDGRSGTISVLFQKPQLEKGVIRRARICGWFLPAENDLAVAVELARQFIDEPLPLTA
jgi:hypothetical protein